MPAWKIDFTLDLAIMPLDDYRKTAEASGWKALAQSLINEPKPNRRTSEAFNTCWIEAGHRVREQIGDDRILVRLLRHMLAPYTGGAVTLFRGESLERWQAGKLGLAWTPNSEMASMFARGLNSVPFGGVLLKGRFEPGVIICGPSAHSEYLGEEQYTIDPFIAENILKIDQFPPIA